MTGKFTGAANGLNKLFIPDLATVKDQATQNVLRKLITWANNLGSNNPSVGQVLTTVANPSKSPYGLSGPTAQWKTASSSSGIKSSFYFGVATITKTTWSVYNGGPFVGCRFISALTYCPYKFYGTSSVIKWRGTASRLCTGMVRVAEVTITPPVGSRLYKVTGQLKIQSISTKTWTATYAFTASFTIFTNVSTRMRLLLTSGGAGLTLTTTTTRVATTTAFGLFTVSIQIYFHN